MAGLQTDALAQVRRDMQSLRGMPLWCGPMPRWLRSVRYVIAEWQWGELSPFGWTYTAGYKTRWEAARDAAQSARPAMVIRLHDLAAVDKFYGAGSTGFDVFAEAVVRAAKLSTDHEEAK